jgi:2-polyprenyl-3-methyl-5-hydroxy-6-metoxy-1,4-benzoquinol methylase
MSKLSQREYWDVVHKAEDPRHEPYSSKTSLKTKLKTLLGEKGLDYLRSYESHLLWNVIYQQYMPKTEGAKLLEVGSAPGDFLVRLNKVFGFDTYGVEYSDIGVDVNRKNFASNGINPENVIHADFFSDEFHSQYNGYFDIVLSRGFIEHFTDVESLIEKHINLLKKGGHLIVSIPNLRGLNYYLSWILNKEVIAIHNIDIMEKERFSKLFNPNRLSPLFCDYYGTFDFTLYNTKENSPMRYALAAGRKLQLGLNAGFRLLFGDKGAENRYFSPHLIYIGLNKG